MNAISAKEINQLIVEKQPVFMLDVRNGADFNDWKIEGENIEYFNVPYFDLIDGVEPILEQIPTDKPIIVVCAKEGSSMMIAEMLTEKGLEVSYLQGGMKTWSEYLYPTKVYEDEDITVHQFIRVGKGCLSYIVTSGEEALIVDPSRFVDTYMDFAAAQGVKITHIVDSHLHADHITGGRELADKTGAKYYLMKSEGAVFEFQHLEQHDKIEFANIKLEVLAVKTLGTLLVVSHSLLIINYCSLVTRFLYLD